MYRTAKFAGFLFLVNALAACVGEKSSESESLRTETFTVSGSGEGAYIATHLHVAYSERVKGIISIGGGPYDCAKGSRQRAQGQCTDGQSFNISGLTHHARELAAANKIDTLNHLSNSNVFVADLEHAGRFSPELSYAVAEFYEELVDEGEVGYLYSPEFESACTQSDYRDPDCRLELLSAGMDRFYERWSRPDISRETTIELPGGNRQLVLLAECAEGSVCRLHVHFRDCGNVEPITAFQLLAEQFGLAILVVSAATEARGCWNWWDYESEAGYATREGRDLKSIIQLIDNL